MTTYLIIFSNVLLVLIGSFLIVSALRRGKDPERVPAGSPVSCRLAELEHPSSEVIALDACLGTPAPGEVKSEAESVPGETLMERLDTERTENQPPADTKDAEPV